MTLPPVNGPTDLPELRTWLLNRFRPGGDLNSVDGRFVSDSLKAAHLWWVEEETCHLLAESAPTWPDDYTFSFQDLPTPAGLAIFAHDIEGTDSSPAANGEPVRVSGIVWGPVTLPPLGVKSAWMDPKDPGRTALGIGMFTRLDLHKGLSHGDLMRSVQVVGALQRDLFGPNARPGDRAVFTDGHEGTLYAYLGRTDWLEDWPAHKALPDSPHANDALAAASMAEDRKLLAALFALTRTSIVTKMHHRPPRHIARRSERKKLSADVVVLRLGGTQERNVGYSAPQPAKDWKHSWIVRPHWRWQAHGPGWSERKLILVGPYKKGPDDAPLLGADRVWRVVPPGGEKS